MCSFSFRNITQRCGGDRLHFTAKERHYGCHIGRNVADMKSVPLGNPDQMLQGQAAGVTVLFRSARRPVKHFIRGITSFGDTYPLIIVDGVQASLHDLNPNDIDRSRY